MAFGNVPGGVIPAPVGLVLNPDGSMAAYDDASLNGGIPSTAARNSVTYEDFSLEAWAGPPDGANPDTGVLVTHAPGANEHGLPTNFGRGRGRWTLRDARFMKFPCETRRAPAIIIG